MRFVLFAALLCLFCHAPSHAQNGTAVLIDSRAFYDPQNGIPKLVEIEGQLTREFAPVVAEIEMLQKKLAKSEGDLRLAKDAYNAASIISLSDDVEKQSQTLRRKSQDAQLNMERRQKQLSEFVEEDVREAIEAYAKAKKYDVVLDVSSDPLYASESWAPAHDRTADFILWYRARPQR